MQLAQQQPVATFAAGPMAAGAMPTTTTKHASKSNAKSRLRTLLNAIFNPSQSRSKQQSSAPIHLAKRHSVSSAKHDYDNNEGDLMQRSFCQCYSNQLQAQTIGHAEPQLDNFHQLGLSKQTNSLARRKLASSSSIGRSKASPGSQARFGQVQSLKRAKSSQLSSAQQSSHEAMRSVDLYLIRQIARSCMVSFCHLSIVAARVEEEIEA